MYFCSSVKKKKLKENKAYDHPQPEDCVAQSDEIQAQGGLSVADGCRCLTKELDMIAC